MKRSALALVLIISFLVAVLAVTPIFEIAIANPSSYVRLFDNVVIIVQSPQNTTYTERTLPLNFTVETNNEEQGKTRYILNKENPVDVATPVVSKRMETGWYGDGSAERNYTFTYPRYTAQGSAVLQGLSHGTYNLTIQRYFPDAMKPEGVTIINATTVSFTVDANPPKISLPSLENSDSSASTAEAKGGVSPPWLPYVAAAVSVAFVAVVAVGVLVYIKKRKREIERL
jgi:hypothetical protein